VNIFEELVILHGQRNSKNLFGVPSVPDIIKHNFRSVVRRTESFPPLMGIKIPTFQGKPTTRAFQAKQIVPIENIKRNAKLTIITEPSSIWVVGTNWGVAWKALQIKIEHVGEEETLATYCFVEDGEDEFLPRKK